MQAVLKLITTLALSFIVVFTATYLIGPLTFEDAMNMGIENYRQHNYQSAIGKFDRALELAEPVPRAHYYKGLCYYSLGDYSKATDEFRQSFNGGPTDAIVFSSRGMAYYKNGGSRKALEDFDNALSLQPDVPLALLYRSEIYLKRGDYQKALADLNSVITLTPEDAEAYIYRATVHTRLDEKQKALQDYNKAIGLIADPAKRNETEKHLPELP